MAYLLMRRFFGFAVRQEANPSAVKRPSPAGGDATDFCSLRLRFLLFSVSPSSCVPRPTSPLQKFVAPLHTFDAGDGATEPKAAELAG